MPLDVDAARVGRRIIDEEVCEEAIEIVAFGTVCAVPLENTAEIDLVNATPCDVVPDRSDAAFVCPAVEARAQAPCATVDAW